jgi:CheY-like chemotaxis protein
MKTIVVIDDDPDTRVTLFDLLTPEGYRVITFEDPRYALRRLHEARPDLILLDYHMPPTDGLELAAQLSLAAPRVPIVMLTAYGSPELYLEASEHGVADMVLKPFSPAELVRAVERNLALPAEKTE